MFQEKDRLLVAWFIQQVEGVNRTDARLVAGVQDAFYVEGTFEFEADKLNEEIEVELRDLEVQWLLDQSKKAFDRAKVPAGRAGWHLEFEEKLEELLAEE